MYRYALELLFSGYLDYKSRVGVMLGCCMARRAAQWSLLSIMKPRKNKNSACTFSRAIMFLHSFHLSASKGVIMVKVVG